MSTRGATRVRWWQWPTVLSLDAPAVALAWQGLLAHAAGVRLHWPEGVVLASGIWMSYAADRWFEGWRLETDTIQTERHRFYHEKRWKIAAVWVLVLAGSLAVSFTQLTPRELGAGAGLLAAVLLYLLSHQLIHRTHPWRAPKEVCVAVLMACGAGVFVAASPGANLPDLATPLILFGLLCFSNCALISAWEHEVDAVHGQTSLATDYARGAAMARLFPLILIFVSLTLAFLQPSSRPCALCALASSTLLWLVDRAEPRLGRRMARVLADAVLLTPLALGVFARLP